MVWTFIVHEGNLHHQYTSLILQPLYSLSLFNRLVQILLSIISRLFRRLVASEILDSLVGNQVELSEYPITILVYQFKRVAVVAVHESPAGGDTSVTHENHYLMDRLGVLREIVPKVGTVVITSEVGGGIALLGVDKVGELCGVTHCMCEWRVTGGG